jgi:hypothetical protein
VTTFYDVGPSSLPKPHSCAPTACRFPAMPHAGETHWRRGRAVIAHAGGVVGPEQGEVVSTAAVHNHAVTAFPLTAIHVVYRRQGAR